jgi:radical SAM protein with 4Fe4S-binding SPASM domain
LLTNATLINEDIIETFKIYPPATVSISVYGMTAQTYESVTGVQGSFQKFRDSVRKLHEADLDIELKFIGLKLNIQDFALAEAFAEEVGAKFKYNFEIFPTLQGGQEGLKYRLSNQEILDFEIQHVDAAKVIAANVLKKNPFLEVEQVPIFTCNVASTLCYIDSNGFVSPCNKMRLKEYNILKTPLSTIWESYIQQYAKVLAPKNYKCAKCSHIHICSPCPVINKLSTGDYVTPCMDYCELTMLRAKEFSKEKYDCYRIKN